MEYTLLTFPKTSALANKICNAFFKSVNVSFPAQTDSLLNRKACLLMP
jgi:hypothetical protein